MKWMSVDPGEKHCGVALWHGERCWRADVQSPEELLRWFDQPRPVVRAVLELVVIEEFRLYPWVMRQLGFDSLRTVEVIGAIKDACRRHGVRVVEQPATIKKVVFAQSRARGYEWTSRGSHARDAEAHGLYWLWHNRFHKKEA